MTKTLIYIGANHLQAPGIRAAKEAGLRVVVTDSNPDAPCIALADEFHCISGTDEKGLIALAREVQTDQDLAGIYCGSDFGLMSVAKVGQACDVPAASPSSVETALDKAQAREVLARAGVAIPQGRAAQTLEDVLEAAEAFGYPLIIKPIDSSGSRGVVTVQDETEINKAYMKALHYSMTVLVEQVVDGQHIDVNGLFVNDTFYPCGQLSRFFSPPPNNYPTWGHEPAALSLVDADTIYREVEKGARALGISCGPVKADVVLGSQGPVILELAPRFHGDVSTSFVTPLVCGSSAPMAWFHHLAGQSFEAFLPKDDQTGFAGWMGVFPDGAGVFQSLDNMDESRAVPGVHDVMVLKPEGYRVKSVTDNLAVLGFLWASGTSVEELKARLDQARAKIHVRMVE